MTQNSFAQAAKFEKQLRDTVTDNYLEAQKILNRETAIIDLNEIVDLPIVTSNKVFEIAQNRERLVK